MTCEQMEEMLPLYVDGDASDDERRQVEGHLDRCPDCVTTLNYLRRADAIVAAWPQVPREMQPRLARIDERVLPRIRRRNPWAPQWLHRPFGYAGLGAFVLVVAVALVGMVSILPGLRSGSITLGQSREEQEAQVREVASEFVAAANQTIQPRGTKSQSVAATARARSYLSPGYQAGLADFRRLVAGDRAVLHLGSGPGGNGRDTRSLVVTKIEDDRATGYVDVTSRAVPTRLLFGFERVKDEWKVARLEAAHTGAATLTPTAAPSR